MYVEPSTAFMTAHLYPCAGRRFQLMGWLAGCCQCEVSTPRMSACAGPAPNASTAVIDTTRVGSRRLTENMHLGSLLGGMTAYRDSSRAP